MRAWWGRGAPPHKESSELAATFIGSVSGDHQNFGESALSLECGKDTGRSWTVWIVTVIHRNMHFIIYFRPSDFADPFF